MLLPLVTPIGPNFLKDFPSQNVINSELIDAYAGPYAIQSYTPQFTATTTNPTLGTGGTLTGFYYRIFDQIYTWGEVKFGTGFAVGSGVYLISLPFNANTIAPPDINSGGGPIVGTGQIWDDSSATGRQAVSIQLRTADKIQFSIRNDSGMAGRLVADNNNPIVWAIGDGISWFARYQRVAS